MENETQKQKEESAMAPELNVSLEGDNLKNVKKLLKGIKSLISEGLFVFDNDGMKLTAMDAANVAMVILFVPKEDFATYNVAETEKIGLKLDEFVRNLNCFKKDVKLNVVDSGNTLNFEDGKFKFTQPLLVLDNPIQKIPDIKFDINVPLNGFGELNVFLKREESVIFEVKGGKFKLRCNTGEAIIKPMEGAGKGRYASSYLEKIFACGEAKTLEFGKDIPLMVTFNNLKMILAPRVDGD